MSMYAPQGGNRSRRTAPAWTPGASSGSRSPAATGTVTAPPYTPSAPAAPTPRPVRIPRERSARGPQNLPLLIGEAVVIVLLAGAAIGLGVARGQASSALSAAKKSASAEAATLASAKTSAASATAGVAADSQIAGVLKVTAKTAAIYQDGLGSDFSINTQSGAAALVQGQLDGFTAEQAALGSLSLPASLQPQLATLKNDLGTLITSSKGLLAAVNSNAANVATSVINPSTQAMQSLEDVSATLEAALGKNG